MRMMPAALHDGGLGGRESNIGVDAGEDAA
jgi:hypothetical protein